MGYFNPRFPWGKRLENSGIKKDEGNISIHASRGGSDRYRYEIYSFDYGFQSTLPVGEATFPAWPIPSSGRHFNPRFPWGKRLSSMADSEFRSTFQSTLPVGEATGRLREVCKGRGISIHASRGGSDLRTEKSLSIYLHFNPRFPWGKRLPPMPPGQRKITFQSTLPVGEATTSGFLFSRGLSVFQSTLPVGEATAGRGSLSSKLNISIHASRGGSDLSLLSFHHASL